MNGQLNVSEAHEILSSYLDKLERGEDSIELLEVLQGVSYLSKEHKEILQKAMLAQMVYSQGYFAAKVPEMLARFEENMEKIDETKSNENIWEYLNRLLAQKGATWKDCLSIIGANAKYSSQITQGNWSLMRFRPEDLAKIAAWIGADPSEIMRLSYEELLKQKESPEGTIHYRVQDQRSKNKNYGQQRDEAEEEEWEFMARLDGALAEFLTD
ncbi:MAG: hypothetical protein GXY34_13455 [Syntrophomonadaceae bacterium]|nr:hypothetical protein [Syntrophomonadaceae bacterium]